MKPSQVDACALVELGWISLAGAAEHAVNVWFSPEKPFICISLTRHFTFINTIPNPSALLLTVFIECAFLAWQTDFNSSNVFLKKRIKGCRESFLFQMKGFWCIRRWQTCVFSPKSVCFCKCDCLWESDASRFKDLTYQPISAPKLTFKSVHGPQLSTLLGEWRSNYCSENHVTHTHTHKSHDWTAGLVTLTTSIITLSQEDEGRGRRWGTIQQSDVCFPGGWERSRGRKAEGACLESFQESLDLHQSSLFVYWTFTSSSLCRLFFFTHVLQMDDCSGNMQVACRCEAASSPLAAVSFCLAVQDGKDDATQQQMLPDGSRNHKSGRNEPKSGGVFKYGGTTTLTTRP